MGDYPLPADNPDRVFEYAAEVDKQYEVASTTADDLTALATELEVNWQGSAADVAVGVLQEKATMVGDHASRLGNAQAGLDEYGTKLAGLVARIDKINADKKVLDDALNKLKEVAPTFPLVFPTPAVIDAAQHYQQVRDQVGDLRLRYQFALVDNTLAARKCRRVLKDNLPDNADGSFDVTGLQDEDMWSREDLEAYRDRIMNMSPKELDEYLKTASQDELNKLGVAMRLNDLDAAGDEFGLSPWDRVDFGSYLLKNASPEYRDKIFEAFPWMQPDPDPTKPGYDGRMSHLPLFGDDGPRASDVRQGQYGDCWAMATAAALAERDPAVLKSTFKDNGDGTVDVRVYDDSGRAHWVTVTTDTPGKSAEGGGTSWPALYEKALAATHDRDGAAMQHGGYRAIEAENPGAAAQTLTGDRGTTISPADVVRRGNSDPIVLSSKEGIDSQIEGLHSGHAYYVKEVLPDGRVVLGNPWGPGGEIVLTAGQIDQYFAECRVVG